MLFLPNWAPGLGFWLPYGAENRKIDFSPDLTWMVYDCFCTVTMHPSRLPKPMRKVPNNTSPNIRCDKRPLAPIHIFTDSTYTFNASTTLFSRRKNFHLTQEIRNLGYRICDLKNMSRPVMHFVPSHIENTSHGKKRTGNYYAVICICIYTSYWSTKELNTRK